MAGYDARKFSGPLRLSIPGKGLPFNAIGHGNAQPERTKSGEVAYVDDEKVVCRYWNCRDCDQTKLNDDVQAGDHVVRLRRARGAGRLEQVEVLEGVEATWSGAADGGAVPELRLG